MRAFLVMLIGFMCGAGVMGFFSARKIEDVERRMFDAQSELAALRGLMAWRNEDGRKDPDV